MTGTLLCLAVLKWLYLDSDRKLEGLLYLEAGLFVLQCGVFSTKLKQEMTLFLHGSELTNKSTRMNKLTNHCSLSTIISQITFIAAKTWLSHLMPLCPAHKLVKSISGCVFHDRKKAAAVALIYSLWGREARLVENETEKPESACCADSLTVSTQTPCAIACISILHTLKIPNTGSHALLGHRKILHTLVGMASAALVAAVAELPMRD